MAAEPWTVAPCGCRFRREISPVGERAFMIKPCHPTCETYIFAQQETRRQGKPIRCINEEAHRAR